MVFYALGYVSISISIIPEDDGSFGRNKTGSIFDYHHRNGRELRQVARDRVVSVFAGLHAQRLVVPDAPGWNADDDEEDVRNVCQWADLAPGGCMFGDKRHRAYLERLRVEARRMVRRNRAAIEALATVLLKKHELDGQEATAIIEPLIVAAGR